MSYIRGGDLGWSSADASAWLSPSAPVVVRATVTPAFGAPGGLISLSLPERGLPKTIQERGLYQIVAIGTTTRKEVIAWLV